MGRVEKKFQKKKDRERAVRKKILAKRADSRAIDKEEKKKRLLERAVNKKTPIRKPSPELQKTLEVLKKLEEKDPDVDSTAEVLPDETVTKVRGAKSSKWLQTSDGK